MSSSSPTTRAVRAALESDSAHGAVVPPLYLSSNFSFEGFAAPRTYDYTRSGNPTRDALCAALCELEGAAGGVVTASGMAAVHVVTQLLDPGDVLVAPEDCYGGSHRLFAAASARGLFETRFVDTSDAARLGAAIEDGVRLVWIETPSNPLMRLTDLRAAIARAREVGAIVCVDNTFLSPALQRPLDLGADLVVHSTTKYLNGHSDVVGGCALARDAHLAERLQWWGNCLGLTGAPFDAFLTLRGLRTLSARITIHERNARELAAILEGHPAVRRVHYPGLASHPQHELAASQQRGFGGMLSFELVGGVESAKQCAEALRVFSLAESLGGVESLVAHPATMTHAAMPPEARQRAGICDGLLRLSVGIEDVGDLRADLLSALDALAPAVTTR